MNLIPLLTAFTLAMTLVPYVRAEEPGQDHVVGTMSEELKTLHDGFSVASEQLSEARKLLSAENLRWRQRQIHGIKIRQHEREEHAGLMAKLESRYKAAMAAYAPLYEQFKEAVEAEFPRMRSIAHSAWFVQEERIGWNDRPVTYVFGF